jgi:hypothetical protein
VNILVSENVFGDHPAIYRQIDMIAGLVKNTHAIGPDLGCGVETTVVDGVPNHPPRIEGTLIAALTAFEFLLVKVNPIINVVDSAWMMDHCLHRVGTLLAELERLRFVQFFEPIPDSLSVCITAISHLIALVLRKSDFISMIRKYIS